MEAWSRLAPRARWLFHLQAIVRLVMFELPLCGAVFGGVWMFSSWRPALVVAAVLALLFGMAAVWLPSLSYDRWRYQLRGDDFVVHRGVLVRRTTSIPLTRIQHIDTRQGLLEQLFGLARIEVYTASGLSADGVVAGLDAEVAAALRDQLVALVGVDDGV